MSLSSATFAARLLALSVIATSTGTLACAPKMPPPQMGLMTGYDRLETAGISMGDFERAPEEIDAVEVVPLDLLEGPHHRVESVRLDHRFLYTYVVDSDHGELEVVGRGLLRKRVLEMEALGTGRPTWLGGARLFAFEVANEVAEPVEGTLQILRHPVRTVTNVPKGIVAGFKALREMKEMSRTHREDDYYLEFLGLSGEKRDWAERMGVDPYSANPFVQARLRRNGWLSLAGAMTVRLATIPVPAGAASIAMSAVGATSGLNEQLRDVAPEDVRVNAGAWLRDDLGADPALTRSFLEQPWYTPSWQDEIVGALSRMQGVAHLDRFIELASRADELHEAYAFTRLALMFAEYHERSAAISEIFTSNDLLLAHTRDGRIVLPLYMDQGSWTAEVEEAESEISASLEEAGRLDVTKLLLVSGHFSPRATDELGLRGWEVIDGLEELWLSERDLARFRPEERSSHRILPELGR